MEVVSKIIADLIDMSSHPKKTRQKEDFFKSLCWNNQSFPTILDVYPATIETAATASPQVNHPPWAMGINLRPQRIRTPALREGDYMAFGVISKPFC